jgi:hypothetical protein
MMPRAGRFLFAATFAVAAFAAVSIGGCGDEDGTPTGPAVYVEDPPDTICPCTTTDLRTAVPTSGSLALVWTAPGDDGQDGTAAQYDIRFSNQPIDDTSWASANPLDTALVPPPSTGGRIETIVIMGLDSGRDYHFALKAVDDVGLWSELSNSAAGRTKDESIPPSAVTDLRAAAIDQTTFELTWTAPGDDYMAGQAATYDIRYSPDPILEEAEWNAATPLTQVPTPGYSGDSETFVATDLMAGKSYFFGLKTSDELGNTSDVSNPAPALGFGVNLWLSPKKVRQGEPVYLYFRTAQTEQLEINLFDDTGWFSCFHVDNRIEVIADEAFPPGVHTIVDDFYNEQTREHLPPDYYIILLCGEEEEYAREWFEIVE